MYTRCAGQAVVRRRKAAADQWRVRYTGNRARGSSLPVAGVTESDSVLRAASRRGCLAAEGDGGSGRVVVQGRDAGPDCVVTRGGTRNGTGQDLKSSRADHWVCPVEAGEGGH